MVVLAPIKLFIIKKNKKQNRQTNTTNNSMEIIPYSPLEQITAMFSIVLQFVFRNCLLALVYLVVWPTNFTSAHFLDSNLLSQS